MAAGLELDAIHDVVATPLADEKEPVASQGGVEASDPWDVGDEGGWYDLTVTVDEVAD